MVEEPAVEESAVEGVPTGVEPIAVGAEEKSDAAFAEEKSDTTVAEPVASATETVLADAGVVTALESAASSEAAASSTEIAPAAEVDPDRARAETRHLLEGEHYERAVVGTSDSMARQMIATELLSALAGRNPERRARARTAFVENGYFDETARDLRDAEASAERAAAARSLALVDDRTDIKRQWCSVSETMLGLRKTHTISQGAWLMVVWAGRNPSKTRGYAAKNLNRSYITKAGHTKALRIPRMTSQNPFAC